jgi:hypothetical protein
MRSKKASFAALHNIKALLAALRIPIMGERSLQIDTFQTWCLLMSERCKVLFLWWDLLNA